MDKIKEAMKSPVFFGFIRALVACVCGAAVKHGVEIGSYVEPITAGVVMLLVMWWSKNSKKPRKRAKPD